jgi:hypothetical protein
VLIEDGTGSGKTVKIDNENHMHVSSVSSTEGAFVNREHGNAYIIFGAITGDKQNPSDDLTSPCVFYIKNTSDDDMIITDIRLWVEEVEYVDIYINQVGTPIGGIEFLPTNMNLNSGKEASGVFLGSPRITGITGGTMFDRLRCPADDGDHNFTWDENIIVPKNNLITMYLGNGGILVEGSVSLYYHEPE